MSVEAPLPNSPLDELHTDIVKLVLSKGDEIPVSQIGTMFYMLGISYMSERTNPLAALDVYTSLTHSVVHNMAANIQFVPTSETDETPPVDTLLN